MNNEINRAMTAHVIIDGERNHLVVWGTDEEIRHLAVCFQDAVAAGDCEAAYLMPGSLPKTTNASVNHWHADEYEQAFLAWRRGEPTTPRVDCYACGFQTPVIEGEERHYCSDCWKKG